MQKYVVLEKAIGQTPLECAEAWRVQQGPEYTSVPLAYAGRLDPMASGKLLVLIGEECKQQEGYHGLDKAYEFSVLFGVKTDTADVLGRIHKVEMPNITAQHIATATRGLIGEIELPYPHFSSKTVKGKPLHVWTLEGRLDEITIPTKASTVFKLTVTNIEKVTGQTIYNTVSQKIETIAPVTDERKALGNDFRRIDVRADWKNFLEHHHDDNFTVATFTCIASSGTYMRTLAEVIAEKCGTVGLAYSIHRTKIGKYRRLFSTIGIWTKQF